MRVRVVVTLQKEVCLVRSASLENLYLAKEHATFVQLDLSAMLPTQKSVLDARWVKLQQTKDPCCAWGVIWESTVHRKVFVGIVPLEHFKMDEEK